MDADMTESQRAYLGLRHEWDVVCAGVRSGKLKQADKDGLYEKLCRLWSRMTAGERREVGIKCVAWFH